MENEKKIAETHLSSHQQLEEEMQKQKEQIKSLIKQQ